MKVLTLAIATATQHTKDGKNAEWVVNSNGVKLWELSSSLTPQEAMDVIKFGRKFEEIAYNEGIDFQKRDVPKRISTLEKIVRNLQAENQILLSENEKIGNKLDDLMKSEF